MLSPPYIILSVHITLLQSSHELDIPVKDQPRFQRSRRPSSLKDIIHIYKLNNSCTIPIFHELCVKLTKPPTKLSSSHLTPSTEENYIWVTVWPGSAKY